MSGISICTYTYNDPELVTGLLDAVKHWGFEPEEIVVVDDGSHTPYDPPHCPFYVRSLRLPQNRGPAAAKHTGISACFSPFVLALDCDIRLAENWMPLVRPLMDRPDVAVAGGLLHTGSGNDLVSRYARHFQECDVEDVHPSTPGPVGFVPGGAWLVRSKAWEDVGGLAGFQARQGADSELCRRFLDKGHELWLHPEATATKVRRMSRNAIVRRRWTTMERQVKRLYADKHSLIKALDAVREAVASRLQAALDAGEHMFAYLELLFSAHAALDLLDYGCGTGRYPAEGRDSRVQGLMACLADYLADYPSLRALLTEDLARDGLRLPPPGACPPGSPDDAAWAGFFAVFDPVRDNGDLATLDTPGARIIQVEERQLGYDFSYYDAF